MELDGDDRTNHFFESNVDDPIKDGLTFNRLGIQELESGNDLEAIKYLEKAFKRGINDSIVTIHSYFNSKGHPAAEYYEGKLLECYTNHCNFIAREPITNYIGQIYYTRKEYEAARDVYLLLMEEKLDYDKAALMYTECCTKLEDWNTVQNFASDRISDDHSDYYYFLVVSNDATKSEKVCETIGDYIDKGCSYGMDRILEIVFKNGMLDVYEKYINTFDERHCTVTGCLGKICEMRNDAEFAEKLYLKSIDQGSRYSIRSLISLYKKSSRIEDTIKTYKMAISQYEMYEVRKEYEEYVNTIGNITQPQTESQTKRSKSNTMEYYLEEGDDFYTRDKLVDAIFCWRLSSRLGSGIAYKRLALYEFDKGCSLSAIKYLKLAVDLGYNDALIILINVFRESDHPLTEYYEEQLIEKFKNGATFDQGQAVAGYAGELFYKNKEYALALNAFAQVHEDNEDYEYAKLTHTRCLLELFEWDKLFEVSNIKANLGFSEYHYFLVEYANHMGTNVPSAIDAYIKAGCKNGLCDIIPIVTKYKKLEEYEAYLESECGEYVIQKDLPKSEEEIHSNNFDDQSSKNSSKDDSN